MLRPITSLLDIDAFGGPMESTVTSSSNPNTSDARFAWSITDFVSAVVVVDIDAEASDIIGLHVSDDDDDDDDDEEPLSATGCRCLAGFMFNNNVTEIKDEPAQTFSSK